MFCRQSRYNLAAAMCFNNKVVLITGASSGIGAACAIKFARSAASLCLIGRNVENLKQIANLCEEVSNKVPLIIIADITSREDIDRIVNEAINKYGKIDVLINSAGITTILGEQADINAFDIVMTTNVRGLYNLTHRVIPHLVKTKGNIVNISSLLSLTPLTIMTPYCMSKAAIDMFTKCLALQLGSKGVRVNAVNPGPVQTKIFTRSGMSDDIVASMFKQLKNNAPLNKITTPEDIAGLVIFLASDNAICITGSCYVIDCGLSLGVTEN